MTKLLSSIATRQAADSERTLPLKPRELVTLTGCVSSHSLCQCWTQSSLCHLQKINMAGAVGQLGSHTHTHCTSHHAFSRKEHFLFLIGAQLFKQASQTGSFYLHLWSNSNPQQTRIQCTLQRKESNQLQQVTVPWRDLRPDGSHGTNGSQKGCIMGLSLLAQLLIQPMRRRKAESGGDDASEIRPGWMGPARCSDACFCRLEGEQICVEVMPMDSVEKNTYHTASPCTDAWPSSRQEAIAPS